MKNPDGFLPKSVLAFSFFILGAFCSGFYFHNSYKVVIESHPLLKYKGYRGVYDGQKKQALWVHEHLTEKSLKGSYSRKGLLFKEDGNVYELHRSTLKDYQKSGFDRGHLVPAGDMKYDPKALEESFLLSNISPQCPEFNRGYWKQLEHYARTKAKTATSVDVISGPLFLPQSEGHKKWVKYQVIGPNEVAVPTHFYKVLQIKEGSEVFYEAYCIPNGPISLETPFSEFRVSLNTLEKHSGLCFKSMHALPEGP